MTERELTDIEARLEAELATLGDPDIDFDLLRDEVPRLVAEVRRLQAQVQAYEDGLAGLDRRIAEQLGDRSRPARNVEPQAGEPGHAALLEALREELRGHLKQR